jgi:hypothetical protein
LGVDEMSTYSPVDELILLMKWAFDEMAVDESALHHWTIQASSNIFPFGKLHISQARQIQIIKKLS